MRSLVALLALGACADPAPITAADVVRVSHPGAAYPADGRARIAFTIATVDDDGRDPMLTATLEASAGAWDNDTASDPRTATIAMKAATATELLVVPRTPGPLSVRGTIAGYTADDGVSLGFAPVAKPAVGATGALSATNTSTLTLSAMLATAQPGGAPSIGTSVAFELDLADNHTQGYLSASRALVVDASTVSVTFTALPSTTLVKFRAVAFPDDADLRAESEWFVISR